MLFDVVVSPFGASVPEMIEQAIGAETAGVSAVWVSDHFSGAVVDRPWSRDPFVCLAAIAARTERIGLGPLVANMANRHPAQLASAIDSLRSLAPHRVRLGVGSGAAPGSRFAVEHEAIGRTLLDAPGRRRLLVDSIGALRAIWAGSESFASDTVGFDGLGAVVDHDSAPPIIVGASAWPTIAVAVEHADGVNLRMNSSTFEHLRRLGDVRPEGFEVSVLDGVLGDSAAEVERRGALEAAGCDRLITTLVAGASFDG